jgi:hypothetical protein
VCAGVGAGLAVVAVAVPAAWPSAAGAAASASTASASTASAAVRVGAAPLGIDVAPWDPVYSGSATLSSVQSLLKAAGVNQLHYGGGVTADQYDWQTDTDLSNCPTTALSEFTNTACAVNDALPFSLYSKNARSLGAQSFVTVNYGTGTTAMAADWVKQSQTSGQAVSQWEIGNESYGCWEDNNWLAEDPADYPGYEANVPATCPMDELGTADGIATMASSYAANAGDYMAAMQAADPGADLDFGMPWAFDGTVGGAGVADNMTWNTTILQADAADIGFVDAHWYAFSFGGVAGKNGNPTAQTVIQSVEQIPAEYAKIRNELNTYDPTATVTVGETGVSYLATNIPCIPAGALFSAGDVLSWLAAGAKNVDWWPLDTDANLGNTCANPDEGMFTNTGKPLTTYTGYLLASQLARPNAELSALTTSSGNVLAFQSVLSNGQVAVALINTNTSSAQKVTIGTSLAGNLTTESYSNGNQNTTDTKIVDGTTTASAVAGGITVPAESITVLKSLAPSAMTLGTTSSSNTFKAGTKVTIKGKLTLNGAAAPAGVSVKITRKVSGSSKVAATLTAKTVTGGTFAATNVPPGKGNYVYQASYTSGTYKPASQSVTVHVTAAKPSLELKVSATSVKAGKTVTVTGTLGSPHVNRTLIIYAQPKGGAKKVIKHATVNSKGVLSVGYTVKANTTFTVTFSGDSWYTSASATAAVKG